MDDLTALALLSEEEQVSDVQVDKFIPIGYRRDLLPNPAIAYLGSDRETVEFHNARASDFIERFEREEEINPGAFPNIIYLSLAMPHIWALDMAEEDVTQYHAIVFAELEILRDFEGIEATITPNGFVFSSLNPFTDLSVVEREALSYSAPLLPPETRLLH